MEYYMKKVFGISVVLALFSASTFALSPENGKKLMKATGCNVCHKTIVDQLDNGMGASLKTIKEKYSKGGSAALIAFFKGDAKPIIEPDRFSTMKAFVLKTKNMTDEQRADIADYILSTEHK
jgi:cytochrome c